MYAAAAAGGLGGLAGQIGETLSAPRRAVWSAMGLPETGSDLMAQTFGMDPDSYLTKGLGLGAEVLGDPLTWAGMGLGHLGAVGARGAGAALGRFLGEESGALRIPASMLGDAAKAGEATAELQGGTRALGLPTGGSAEGVFPGARLNLPPEGRALPLPEGVAAQDLSLGGAGRPALQSDRSALIDRLNGELGQEHAAMRSAGPPPLSHEGIPVAASPAQAQQEIGRLYQLMQDFEQDAAAGQAGSPVEVMAKRSRLWQEILRAEHSYQARSTMGFWTDERLGHLGVSSPDGEAPSSYVKNLFYGGDDVPPQVAPWLAEVDHDLPRNFTPEQVRAIVGRANDFRGERSLLPMVPEQHRGMLSEVLGGEANGVEGGVPTHSGMVDLHGRATRAGQAGAHDLNGLENAAYERVDQPALYLQQGRGTEQEALSWIAHLKAQGYPVDDNLAIDLWRRRAALQGGA